MFVVQNLASVLTFRLARTRYALRYRKQLQAPGIFLVNGSPKSGTTWVRMMLSAVPGYFPGGHFTGSYSLYRSAQPGAVLHGHETRTPGLEEVLAEKDIRVICTIRDPRDQLVSNMFHLRRDRSHAFHETIRTMDDVSALRVVIEGAPGSPFPDLEDMIRLTDSWRDPDSLCRFVRYEDLLSDTEPHLLELFRFLQLPPDSGFVRALSAYFRFERVTIGRNIWRRGRSRGSADPASHFRKGISGDWKNYFKSEHIALVKSIAGDTLVEWGYEQGLDW